MEQQIELTAGGVWQDVAARLREALNDTTFQTWFGEVGGATVDGDALVITVPNDFTREWIEGHFLGLIGAAVRDVTGQERHVGLTVSERVPPETPTLREPPPRTPANRAGRAWR